MGKKFHLDTSPTGVEHHIEIDHDGNELTAVEFTPTHVDQAIVDSCADLRRMTHRLGTGLQHAARIPVNIYHAWKKEWREKYADSFTWPTFEAMKLNSRDYEYLRTNGTRGGSKKL